MVSDEATLRDFLLSVGLVSRAQMGEAEALIDRRGRADEIETYGGEDRRHLEIEPELSLAEKIVSLGILSRDDMRRAEASVLGIPFIDIRGERIDPHVLTLIPEAVSRAHNAVVYRRAGDVLEVVLLDTADLAALEFLHERLPRVKLQPRLTSEDSLRAALVQYQQLLRRDFGEVLSREAGALRMSDAALYADPNQIKKQSKERSAIRAVDALLRHALAQGATDVHVEPHEKELLIRYRIGGRLHTAMALPKAAAESMLLRLKALANIELSERTTPQDGSFRVNDGARWVSVEVSTVPVVHGEKAAVRLRKEDHSGLSLEGLGFRGAAVEALHSALHQCGGGLIVVAGEHDSRKMPSLYAMLEILNTPTRSLGTIENRIMRSIPHINQTVTRRADGLTFAAGLRALLKQDADAVMVGEVNEDDVASLAVDAALGGRLLLAAHPARTAMEALADLRGLEVDPISLSAALRTAVGHGTVRRLQSVKESYIPTQRDLETLSEVADMNRVLAALKEEKVVTPRATWRDIPFYRPRPTADCEDGYKGRVHLQEVVPIGESLKDYIAHGASAEDLASRARAEGNMSLVEDGIFKAAQGLTSLEEVMGMAG